MCGEKRMLFYDYYCFMMNVVCFIFYDLAMIWLVGCVVKDLLFFNDFAQVKTTFELFLLL